MPFKSVWTAVLKKFCCPSPVRQGLGSVPSDLIGAFSLIFYSSPEDAVFKALGVE